jgi:DNA-binding NarL/FixJ family response regulator
MTAVDISTSRPRVLIADACTLVAAGLRKLLEAECDVVGVIQDGRALLDEAMRLRPDIVVMELMLPGLNGMDLTERLARLAPESKVIIVSQLETSSHVAGAFKAGASGYVLKRSSPDELSLAIDAVRNGRSYLTPLTIGAGRANGASHNGAPRPLPSLTPRQREVLQLIGEGRGTKQIALLLNISVKTVEFHKSRIMDELNLHSTVELARYAIADGLVSL